MHRLVGTAAVAVLALGACGGGSDSADPTTTSSTASTTTTTRATTTTTQATTTTTTQRLEPFALTVDEYVESFNLLPLGALNLTSDPPLKELSTTSQAERLYGNRLDPDTRAFLVAASPGDPVEALIVVADGDGSGVSTPAQLLAAAAGNLFDFDSSTNVLEAFRESALPRLNEITRIETTIGIGSYLDMHAIVLDDGQALAFAFVRVGEDIPVEVYDLPDL
jgi:hypothetical protein